MNAINYVNAAYQFCQPLINQAYRTIIPFMQLIYQSSQPYIRAGWNRIYPHLASAYKAAKPTVQRSYTYIKPYMTRRNILLGIGVAGVGVIAKSIFSTKKSPIVRPQPNRDPPSTPVSRAQARYPETPQGSNTPVASKTPPQRLTFGTPYAPQQDRRSNASSIRPPTAPAAPAKPPPPPTMPPKPKPSQPLKIGKRGSTTRSTGRGTSAPTINLATILAAKKGLKKTEDPPQEEEKAAPDTRSGMVTSENHDDWVTGTPEKKAKSPKKISKNEANGVRRALSQTVVRQTGGREETPEAIKAIKKRRAAIEDTPEGKGSDSKKGSDTIPVEDGE